MLKKDGKIMENKPVNELIKDERDREIDLKASRNARIVEGYVVALIVIVSLICKQGFVGWIVLSVDCLSVIVETATRYYYYREKSHIRKIVLSFLLFICAAFLAVSGIIQR